MFESERLARERAGRLAVMNLVLPATLGLAATALGWLLGAAIG